MLGKQPKEDKITQALMKVYLDKGYRCFMIPEARINIDSINAFTEVDSLFIETDAPGGEKFSSRQVVINNLLSCITIKPKRVVFFSICSKAIVSVAKETFPEAGIFKLNLRTSIITEIVKGKPDQDKAPEPPHLNEVDPVDAFQHMS